VQLEPIFLASEDIRAQLPDDTRRFEQIDGAFKEMMREAQAEPGVIEACTYEGREELLNNTYEEIEICEKALNEYLEQKKKIFARFYFVADQALLDILSNGNNPEKVDEYLSDCFDGMKRLEFVRGAGIPYPSKRAKGMFSNEGEYVPFETNFEAVGAVENYLNDLQTKMQITLRDVLDLAKQTADLWELNEKPRHIWLEDYCAQIALLATGVMWTEETGRAFDDHEGGSETAMKDYFNQIVGRIGHLIERVRTPLGPDLRVKIITIITIDVHSRDVVDKFCLLRMYDQGGFLW
jgi:dynein heavy chain